MWAGSAGVVKEGFTVSRTYGQTKVGVVSRRPGCVRAGGCEGLGGTGEWSVVQGGRTVASAGTAWWEKELNWNK